MIETLWPANLEIFTLRPFRLKVHQLPHTFHRVEIYNLFNHSHVSEYLVSFLFSSCCYLTEYQGFYIFFLSLKKDFLNLNPLK